MTVSIWLPIVTTISLLALYWLMGRNTRDDVAFVPGPENESLLVGNMNTLANSPSDEILSVWSKSYGGIVKLHGVLAVKRHILLISDPAALRHIFGSSTGQWDSSARNLDSFKSLFGPGIAAVGGADHLRQRRVVAQALTPAAVRAMIGPVRIASRNTRNALRKICLHSPGSPTQVDMLDWARRCALDSLSMTAFGVELNTIDEPEKSHDLLHTFESMLEDCLGKTTPFRYFLRETATAGIYPSLLGIALVDFNFLRSMFGTSKKLARFSLSIRKMREQQGDLGSGNDLLTLLEIASKGNGKYTLSEDEIRAQIGMVAFAGQDTVSTTLSMFVNDMACYPHIQERLRHEIIAKQDEIGGDGVEFTQEDYESMPYLNAVLKESMRLNPVLGHTFRTSRADDVLPLTEPIRCTDGKLRSELSVSKGTVVIIDIASSNRRKDVWGQDADVFNPERWLVEQSAVPLVRTPGVVYGSVLNFVAGNRTCPGWRIAVLELHVFICDLLLGFCIRPVPGVSIEREFHGVSIPKVSGKPVKGGEVPMLLEAL